MHHSNIVKSLLCIIVFAFTSTTAWSQDLPKEVLLDYGVGALYDIKGSYSVLYDNPNETAKINEFGLEFFTPDNVKLGETIFGSHPEAGSMETYKVNDDILGFRKINFTIISLHSGEIGDFTTDQKKMKGMFGVALHVPEPIPEVIPEPKSSPEVEEVSVVEPTSDPAIEITEASKPLISESMKDELDSTLTSIDQALEQVEEKETELRDTLKTPTSVASQLDNLILKCEALSVRIANQNEQALKTEVTALIDTLKIERENLSLADKFESLESIRDNLTSLRNNAVSLKQQVSNLDVSISEDDVSNLEASIQQLSADLAPHLEQINALRSPAVLSQNALERLQEEYEMLANSRSSPLGLILGGLIIIGLLGLGILNFVNSGKSKVTPTAIENATRPFIRPEHSANSGVIFANSPMLAGNIAAPLSAAGQLTASQMQMLTGPYVVLREAYEATGRIGYAQESIPDSQDHCYGTGFLISPRHIVTNRHVAGYFGYKLTDPDDPGGIEFIGEKGKDSSDFVPFNGEPALLLPGLDIAIYTLARAVTYRKPLKFKPESADHLDGREIVVIGYPDVHPRDRKKYSSAFEEDPVFAVKRISEGKIFRHSTDTDTPYGVEDEVGIDDETSFEMRAVCHNASTTPGNSGSPLIDLRTGKLLGIHFRGYAKFNKEEAANLAMIISQLVEKEEFNRLSS